MQQAPAAGVAPGRGTDRPLKPAGGRGPDPRTGAELDRSGTERPRTATALKPDGTASAPPGPVARPTAAGTCRTARARPWSPPSAPSPCAASAGPWRPEPPCRSPPRGRRTARPPPPRGYRSGTWRADLEGVAWHAACGAREAAGRPPSVWNHFQYSCPIKSEFILAGRRRFQRLRAVTRSCGPGQPWVRGRGNPSHRLERIHPMSDYRGTAAAGAL